MGNANGQSIPVVGLSINPPRAGWHAADLVRRLGSGASVFAALHGSDAPGDTCTDKCPYPYEYVSTQSSIFLSSSCHPRPQPHLAIELKTIHIVRHHIVPYHGIHIVPTSPSTSASPPPHSGLVGPAPPSRRTQTQTQTAFLCPCLPTPPKAENKLHPTPFASECYYRVISS